MENDDIFYTCLEARDNDPQEEVRAEISIREDHVTLEFPKSDGRTSIGISYQQCYELGHLLINIAKNSNESSCLDDDSVRTLLEGYNFPKLFIQDSPAEENEDFEKDEEEDEEDDS